MLCFACIAALAIAMAQYMRLNELVGRVLGIDFSCRELEVPSSGNVMSTCITNKLGRKVLSSTVYGTIATVIKARATDHLRNELGDAEPAFEVLANVARNRAEANEIATI